MRIIMPLFEFKYEGSGFKFTEHYSIEPFDHKKDIPKKVKGLSTIDLSNLSLEEWALVVNNPNEYYRAEINLLLIAFRIYAQSNTFIKWRFCENNSSHSTIINDRFRNIVMPSLNPLNETHLALVQNGFLKLKEMYKVSDRTKNALYFTWRGLSSDKHIDAYIFLVCAIESLFSKETAGGTTKIIVNRIQKYLSDRKGFGRNQIKNIYKIRSDMVHGRILHTDKTNLIQRQQNIMNVGQLELLVFECMKKMLEERSYLNYKDTIKKEEYLNKLTNGQ